MHDVPVTAPHGEAAWIERFARALRETDQSIELSP